MHSFFDKMLALLRIRPMAAGLDVSDQVIRLMYFSGGLWQMHAVRLEPGVMENGKVKNKAAFMLALSALKAQSKIARGNKKKKIAVTVSLSSATAFSQIFTLPTLGGEELQKAVDLNLQMASPGDASQFYSGWQVTYRDEAAGNMDVLGAFIDRALVDDVVGVLFEVGFLPKAVESRSLALARVFREKGSGADPKASYLFANVDNVGFDFLVIRKGQLHFEYSIPWRDVANEKGELSAEEFETSFTASLRQVINFYGKHWQDPIASVVISASAFEEQIEKVVTAGFAMKASQLTLVLGKSISSEWLVALGCGLRAAGDDHKEINFLGSDWEDRFRDEQILGFLEFWDVAVPAALGVLVAMFIGANWFLANEAASIEASPNFQLNAAQSGSTDTFTTSTLAFNNLVSMTGVAERSGNALYGVIRDAQSVAKANGVTLNRLAFPGVGLPVSLGGMAPSQDAIIAFKNAMVASPNIVGVDLPLSAIQPLGASFSFSMTFERVPSQSMAPQSPGATQ